MVFTATNKAPGVYIDEVQLPGPIPGVGTSTAAFVGPAKRGPINKPVFLTNWTQFTQTFGVPDGQGGWDPYLINPDVFVTHAVRGFFDNGGTTCYFVRVSKARAASKTLNDGATTPQPALKVTAKQEGAAGNSLTVAVQPASAANTSVATPPQATLAAPVAPATLKPNQVLLTSADDAKKYFAGDVVLLTSTAANPPAPVTATITRIDAATVTLDVNVDPAFSSGTMRVADLFPGQTSFRVRSVTGIEPGTYLTISQITPAAAGPPAVPAKTVTEFKVVQAVEKISKTVTLAQPLAKGYPLTPDTKGAVPAPGPAPAPGAPPPPAPAPPADTPGTPATTLQSQEFSLVIAGAVTVPNLSLDFRHSRYFPKVVNSPDVAKSLSVYVDFPDAPNPTPPPLNLPAALAAPVTLDPGTDENLAGLGTNDYTGGIDALAKLDDVNLLCVPDGADDPAVQKHMIEQCESLQDRFAILDPNKKDDGTGSSIRTQLQGDGTAANPGLGSDGGYGALYFPHILITHPAIPGQTLTIPPSGHLAGMFARTDNDRGVHKAPANEVLRGALAVQYVLNDGEQGPLNEIGVNVIRFQKGRAVVCMGARTTSIRTQWRYVSTRRLLIFIEKSIQQGTQFAVFEPNELALWQKIKRQVTDFLTRVWNDGALFGASADAAFRVRIDEELNPPAVRALGQLIIEVVVIPAFPAEFVVFRIIQDPTGATLQEK